MSAAKSLNEPFQIINGSVEIRYLNSHCKPLLFFPFSLLTANTFFNSISRLFLGRSFCCRNLLICRELCGLLTTFLFLDTLLGGAMNSFSYGDDSLEEEFDEFEDEDLEEELLDDELDDEEEDELDTEEYLEEKTEDIDDYENDYD